MTSIVFFDSQVSDYQTLAQNLKGETQGVILDPTQDGIEQISRYLESHETESLHIISHGAPGTLYLGNGSLNLTNLNDYASTLSNWKVSQIFLYGCHVAKGDAGAEFIDKLHQITGAGIAATQTLTGNKELGGNWNLAVTRGQITSGLVIAEEVRNAYAGVLATYTVNTIIDENDGVNSGSISLRDAINAANANPGADTILFNPAFNNAVIGLSNGQLEVRDDVTIRGNGTRISGRNNSRVFYIYDGSSNINRNVTIEGLQIIDGNRSSYSGGVYNNENLRLINTNISNNTSYFGGGGIYNDGVIAIINSTISNNTASNNYSGGGFFNDGTATVINSTVNNNTSLYGGGIYNDSGALFNIINTTISNNGANEYGGGIYNYGQANIFNSTITRNSASSGGSGIASDGRSGVITQLGNSIVSGNNTDDVFYNETNNTIYSAGGNLIGTGNAVGAFNQPRDQTGVLNPQLGALANNGGPTLTHKPSNNSPAINGGFDLSIPLDSLDIDGDGNTSERLPLDQTGNIRVQESSVDIGAVETNYGGVVVPPLVSIADTRVTEGNSGRPNAGFVVSLNRSFTQPVTIKYSTANGTGVSPQDFAGVTNGTLVIPTGSTSGTINIPVVGETTPEGDETFSVRLLQATNGTLNRASAIGTIVNDDFPRISLGQNITVREGNAGATNVNIPITLSQRSSVPVRVTVSTANGTATSSSDFVGLNQTITFPANQTTATARVAVRGDTVFEANENFSVNLSNPVNGVIGTNRIQIGITNDDVQPRIFIDDARLTEGNSGTRNMVFQLRLSSPTSQTVSADYITGNGTAVAPTDYDARSGRVSFTAGRTTTSLSIPVRGDTVFEPNETFTVGLSNIINASIGRNRATGTILNDDIRRLSQVSRLSLGSADTIKSVDQVSELTKNSDYSSVFAVNTLV